MNYKRSQRIGHTLLSAFLFINLIFISFFQNCLTILAAPGELPDYPAEAEARKSLPIQSNQTDNWPAGPAIGAEAAILMEVGTGAILYAKNIDEKLYPASTTKLMTSLLALENCRMDEIVTFSHNAVFSIERGSSNIGIDEGEAMPLEECLYGILVASANEVANGVAEHVAGSMDEFADMMNEKAKELGCTNTHFVNAHGLFDEEHYTTAYDLALIAKAFFQNEQLARLGNTASHHFLPTDTQPDDFVSTNKHRLVTGSIPYEGIKGGKTGYTDEARQTLVTCAEQGGMKLICVIMKEESPDQFYDTVELFDYGFTNFSVVNISDNETRYSMGNSNFFHTSNDIFGNSSPILSLNRDSYLVMPRNISFEHLEPEISYNTENSDGQVAVIDYYYHGAYLGTASLEKAETTSTYDFTEIPEAAPVIDEHPAQEQNVIVVNIKIVLIAVVAVAAVLIVIFIIHSIIVNYSFLDSRRERKRRRKRKKNRKDGPRFSSRSRNLKF